MSIWVATSESNCCCFEFRGLIGFDYHQNGKIIVPYIEENIEGIWR